jgi:hypothetical protein
MLRRMLLTLGIVGLVLILGLWSWTNGFDQSLMLSVPFEDSFVWIGRGWIEFNVGRYEPCGDGFFLPPSPFATGIRRLFYSKEICGLRMLATPLWMMAALFGATIMVTWLPYRQVRRRRLHGLCVRCGYDLRGSPEKCPECGTVPKSPPLAPQAERTTTPGM